MDVEVLFNNIISGNVSFFEESTRREHFNLEQVIERGNSILHVAAKFGKLEIMKKVLNSQSSLLYMTNCKGNTALHIAAILGNVDTTKLLITSAKDKEVETRMELLRMQNQEKNIALHEAIRNYRYDIVELLSREDPGLALFTNNAEESPLFLVVDLRFYKIALHILEAVPNCSYGGRKGMNFLHAAVINRPKIGKIKLKLHDGTVRFMIGVQYIPDFKQNLISVGLLESKGFKIAMENGTLKILNGALVVMMATRHRNLYFLKGSTIVGGAAIVSDIIREITADTTILLGHADNSALQRLVKQDLLKDVKTCKFEFCELCILGKQIKVKIGIAIHLINGMLDYVHTDVWGLAKVASFGGRHYFVNDYSR
ncbi:transposable element gene [Fagus crenata]